MFIRRSIELFKLLCLALVGFSILVVLVYEHFVRSSSVWDKTSYEGTIAMLLVSLIIISSILMVDYNYARQALISRNKILSGKTVSSVLYGGGGGGLRPSIVSKGSSRVRSGLTEGPASEGGDKNTSTLNNAVVGIISEGGGSKERGGSISEAIYTRGDIQVPEHEIDNFVENILNEARMKLKCDEYNDTFIITALILLKKKVMVSFHFLLF